MTFTSMLIGPLVAFGLVLPAALKVTEPPQPTAVEIVAANQVAAIAVKLDRVEKRISQCTTLNPPPR